MPKKPSEIISDMVRPTLSSARAEQAVTERLRLTERAARPMDCPNKPEASIFCIAFSRLIIALLVRLLSSGLGPAKPHARRLLLAGSGRFCGGYSPERVIQ